MKNTKIIVCGAEGRMGQAIVRLSQNEIIPVVEGGNIESNIQDASVIIDFTSPEASMSFLKSAVQHQKPLVIGTTGFTDSQRKEIEVASKTIPLIFSPNMSIGVNVMFRLTQEATRLLGKDFEVKIHEIHHNQKKDAPSGTAKKLQEIVEREKNSSIPVSSERTGDVVGDHTVYFEGIGERLEIFHHASSRDTFAQGALRAAEWLIGKKPGLYNMQDVLGLK